MNHRFNLRSSFLRRPSYVLGTVALTASAMLLSACGSDSADTTVAAETAAVETTVATDTTAAAGTTPTAETAAPAAGDAATASALTVSDVWARTSPMMNGAGAMYLKIANGGDAADALVSVSVPADVATKVELHETVAAESMDSAAMGSEAAMAADTTMSGMGSDEMMMMRPVESIEIPAKGEAVLAPGGFHIMLLEMPKTLATGSTFEATLTFRSGTAQKVQVEVRDQ